MHALEQHVPVGLPVEIVREDRRPSCRIVRRDPNMPPALGPQLRDRRRHAGELVQPLPRPDGRQRHEVDLQVRRLEVRMRLHEHARDARPDRQDPAPLRDVLEARLHLVHPAVPDVVEARGQRHLIDVACVEMVLQVLAHPLHVVHHVHAGRLQDLAGPDARHLKDHRRPDRACRQQHLAPRMNTLPDAIALERHAGHPAFADLQLLDVGVGHDREVPARHRGLQVADPGRRPPPVPGRELVVAGALLRGPVEVLRRRDAGRHARRDIGFAQRVVHPHVRHAERPVATVQLVFAALIAL